MWFLPSYGRPKLLERLLTEAPGGLPRDLVVYLTAGDPHFDEASIVCARANVKCRLMPSHARLADILRRVFEDFPQEPCYGFLSDDHWPVTAGWWAQLEAAAGTTRLAHSGTSNDTSPVPGTPCFGGGLVRAMGGLVPPGCACRHNYIDNIWRMLGETFTGLIVPVPEVEVRHDHWIHGKAEKDATYARGSDDMAEDRKLFEAWNAGTEKKVLFERVAALLGTQVSSVDLSKLHLVVAVPASHIDAVFLQSYTRMMIGAFRHGLRLTLSATVGVSHIGKARERALWDAMAYQPTHILFIDDDMGWDDRLPFRLLAADLDFACAVGVRKQDDVKLCCNFFPGDQVLHPVNRFLKVKDVGFAFVMLKREVIERMVEAYPDLAYEGPEGRIEHALFLDILEDMARLSEDYSFCRRWRAIGGEIWADRHAALIHAGRKEYTGSIDALFRGRDNVDMTTTDKDGDPRDGWRESAA